MGFSKSKYFKMTAGNYYFQIKSGQQNVLMYRSSKERAADAYHKYIKVGKPCEWLGQWNGKKFEDTEIPEEIKF